MRLDRTMGRGRNGTIVDFLHEYLYLGSVVHKSRLAAVEDYRMDAELRQMMDSFFLDPHLTGLSDEWIADGLLELDETIHEIVGGRP
jgi:hypothetical protein